MLNSKQKRPQHHLQHRPRLDRRNAIKNIDYYAGDDAFSSPSSSSNSFSGDLSVHKTRSLDLLPLSDRTSFRMEGIEGEADQIFRYLGLNAEDLSIPVSAWEARKSFSPKTDVRSADRGDSTHGFGARVRVGDGELEDTVGAAVVSEYQVKSKQIGGGGWGIRPSKSAPSAAIRNSVEDNVAARVKYGNCEAGDGTELVFDYDEVQADDTSENQISLGIRGCRPPTLAPPPAVMRSVVDHTSSTWDIFRGFGPQDNQKSQSPGDTSSHPIHRVEESEEVGRRGINVRQEMSEDAVEEDKGISLESCSDSSTDERGDSSIGLVGDNSHTISPSGSFSSNITSWQKGDFLGSGSFGTVYEGFTDDGLFFAVKEVSLLDQGSQGQQSIYQLEQEISLLKQFQHENIVRYLGTDKDNGKLYIFLELVTKGSLAKLYEKYQLRDSQVSSYTRQILSGLNYLHSRDVVHRDIKCANILVDVSGSVKLADFGLAKATKLNDIKSCKGTPYWMAPEVVNQRNHGYGRAADIWSLGCTVLEMLTGQIPYSHLEGMQALFRIGRGELPPIPNTLSRDAQDFILKCLQVNPDNRSTAAQLLEHPFVKKSSSSFTSPASPHYSIRS
ncbi:mitogen-activated protein kinase kinase kinase [Salvia divinorum]|uniref:mitogen-activated protein kinase kinase kinase n=1 Tax=Salvia divinorum TaxID=28513 RepID=A0ABD1GMN4_SALDI